MNRLTILVTVDAAGVPHCTPVLDKKKVEVVWVMGTAGWEFDDLVGLPPFFFANQIVKGDELMSLVKHPLGNIPTDFEYTITVKPTATATATASATRTSGKAIIRNEPT